jgi:hypothetical protein
LCFPKPTSSSPCDVAPCWTTDDETIGARAGLVGAATALLWFVVSGSLPAVVAASGWPAWSVALSAMRPVHQATEKASLKNCGGSLRHVSRACPVDNRVLLNSGSSSCADLSNSVMMKGSMFTLYIGRSAHFLVHLDV